VDAGVVDERVDATVALEHGLGERRDVSFLRDVDAQAEPAQFLGRGLVPLEVGDDDGRPLLVQSLRDGAADPLRSARDDGDAVGEPHLSIPPMARYLISSQSSMPYFDPSRPVPDSLMPPKGATSVETKPVLTPTMPYSRPSPTRHTRPMSRL